MMKPKPASRTKYFIALIPKGSNDADPSRIHVFIDKAWKGYRFELLDINAASFETYINFSRFGADDDKIIWFPTIQKAYEFATFSKMELFKTMEKSNMDIDAFEWQIMSVKAEIHAVNNLDEAIAGVALEDLKSKMTPAQLEILKNSI